MMNYITSISKEDREIMLLTLPYEMARMEPSIGRQLLGQFFVDIATYRFPCIEDMVLVEWIWELENFVHNVTKRLFIKLCKEVSNSPIMRMFLEMLDEMVK